MATNNITDADFQSQVLEAKQPVLVDFWAEWCGPCQRMGPILEDASKDLEGKASIAKLNVDENPERTQEFGVMSIPTMILFKNGQPVDTLVGVMTKEALLSKIESHLS